MSVKYETDPDLHHINAAQHRKIKELEAENARLLRKVEIANAAADTALGLAQARDTALAAARRELEECEAAKGKG